MPKRFYVAWALAVILALVLPVAIPYFIWPPQSYDQQGFDPTQAKLHGPYAEIASLLPSSVRVKAVEPPTRRCHSGGAEMRLQSGTVYDVVLRGAYGIPFGSIEVSCRTESGLKVFLGGGLLLAGLAWLSGMAVVSIPFVLMLERRLAERRGARSFLSRALPS